MRRAGASLEGIQNHSQQQTCPNKPQSRVPISIIAGAHPNTPNWAPREWTGAIFCKFRNIFAEQPSKQPFAREKENRLLGRFVKYLFY
jgi:hypothetical protein